MTEQQVVGTENARQAAREMRRILGSGLSAHLQALVAQGRTLSRPNVWDGPQANTFRQAQWPSVERSLIVLQQRLPAMQAEVESVLEDIIHSGTTGTLAVASAAVAGRFVASYLRLRPPVQAAIDALAGRRGVFSLQGDVNEGALLMSKAGVADLNWFVGKGKNFPFLDAASKDGFFSAKAHLAGSWLDAYRDDFVALTTGKVDGARKTLQDAVALLREHRNTLVNDHAWPRGLDPNADADAIEAFILEHAKLAVPNDQVAAIRRFIGPDILELAGKYGLPSATEADAARLLRRIVPSGVDSGAVGRITNLFRGFGRDFQPNLVKATALVARIADSPVGKAMKWGGQGLAVAGDLFTLVDPSPGALGGPTIERAAASLNLAGLLAANVASDWIPGVGEVTMGATAVYFIGDLAWQNRQWIEDTGSHALHSLEGVASSAFHKLTSWL